MAHPLVSPSPYAKNKLRQLANIRLGEPSDGYRFPCPQTYPLISNASLGLPHYGHLLASTIKDIIPRYWSMKGHHVIRRFGWDTHGLPIEFEIDKKLGISGRDAVERLGIEKYNAECRAVVMRYAQEWRQTIDRLGRWIDFNNDYKVCWISDDKTVSKRAL